MKLKNYLLWLGSFGTVVSPIVAVIACTNDEVKEEENAQDKQEQKESIRISAPEDKGDADTKEEEEELV